MLAGLLALVLVALPGVGAAATGLVAAYSFDEGAGTTVGDASGNGNTGTIIGPTWTPTGKYGAALRFDGTNDLVLISASSSLNLATGMTLEAWVLPTATQSGWRTIIQRETDAFLLHASYDNGALHPAAGGTFSGVLDYTVAPSALIVNAWSHLAVTWDGATLRLYVNGTQVASQARAGTLETTAQGAGPIRIGGNSPYGEFFRGHIDEVRVYDRALSAAEIQADMNAPIGSTTPDATPPSSPGGLGAAAASATQINLAWSAATDNVGVTGYRLERCQGAGCAAFTQIAAVAGTTFNNTGLVASTSYSYRVRATDAAGNLSPYSSVASATTRVADSSPPAAPAGLGATAVSATQVNLAWTAATDNVGVTGYWLERCQGAGCTAFAMISTPAATAFSDSLGLAASTSYRYRVRATDAAGNQSAFSNIASVTTPAASDTTRPTAPADLAATAASNSQINLTWTASTDNVGVTGYRILRCTGAGCTTFTQIATSTTTSYSNTGLSASTTYRYRVRAVDAANNVSTISNTVTTTTPAVSDTAPPAAPASLGATAVGSTQINLSWTAASDNVGVTGYQLERCQGAGCTSFTLIATATGTTFNDTGLTASTSYSYRLRATDGAGNVSGYSNVVSTATPGSDMLAPTAPTGLTATPGAVGQVNLAWTAATDNVAVTGYRLERCQGAGCTTFAQIATSSATSFSDTGLTASTSYSYRARAADASGNLGEYSNVASATVAAAGPSFGLEFPGDGTVRRMLYWHNPFPIYDATYIFKVFPRKKIGGGNPKYYTTFFWGNDGSFIWDGGNANTYYGAHPYPIPAPNGPGQWEISVYGNDFVTGSEVQWDRWYTQAFRAWRESPSVTHHEFYWDLPDMTKVIRETVVDSNWARRNPPTPAIVMGQAPDVGGVSWGGYPGWEEFNGIIRGIQFYSGLLSVADIQSEIAAPMSTTAGRNTIWYLNLNPRPSDVTDKKGIGTPHNPSWSGTTAREWVQ